MNEPRDEDLTKLAKIGYEAYGARADWKNFEGKPMPKWDNLRPDICEKWKDASRAMIVSDAALKTVSHLQHYSSSLNSTNSETLSNDIRSTLEQAKARVLHSILFIWDKIENEGELVKEAHFNNIDLHWFEKVISPDIMDSFIEPNFIRGKFWGATIFGSPSIPEGTLRLVGETKFVEGTLIRKNELDDYLNVLSKAENKKRKLAAKSQLQPS